MSAEIDAVPEGAGELDEVLAAYFEAEEAGGAPDRRELLSCHPAVARELAAFFADLDRVEPVVAPVLGALGPPAPEVPSFGAYEALEKIGEGGMGVVYKARHKGLKVVRALKMIRAGRPGDADEVQRLRTEARRMADLNHPHIVPVYEVGEYMGQPYFSMKWMAGGSLKEKIADFRLPALDRKSGADEAGTVWARSRVAERARRIARLVETLARAVHHAHQRGLLHRDLKPGNILLDEQGQPYVTDFGLAKRLIDDPQAATLSSQADSRGPVGTVLYMAPEQTRAGEELTVAVDVYGLGAILYELLAGQPPFEGSDLLDLLDRVRGQEPIAPSRLGRHVPRDLEKICLSCLRKEPAKRYESAALLADDLSRFQAGEPVRARPVSPWERAVKWAKRKPAVAALAAAVVLVVALAGGTVLWQWREKTTALDELESSLVYISRIQQIHGSLLDGYPFQADQTLQRCPKKLRHWEWHFLQRWCRRDMVVLQGHSGAVRAIAFGPKGTTLASAGADGTVRLWDWSTGEPLLLVDRGPIPIDSLTFSGDGRHLAWATRNFTAKVWDIQARRTLCTSPGAGNNVALSPDGRLLASTGNGKTIHLWDVPGGQARRDLPCDDTVDRVVFSPDGRWMASAGWGEKRVLVWDTRTWQSRVFVFEPRIWKYELAFSPDSRHLAAATRGQVRIWDVQSGEEVRDLRGYTGDWASVAFSADGHLALSFQNGNVTVWDVADGKMVSSGRRHTDLVSGVAFSPGPHSRHLAYTRGNEIVIERWKGTAGPQVRTLAGLGGEIRCVAFSPDGQRVASASNDARGETWAVRARSTTTGETLLTLQGKGRPLNGLAFDADGWRLASAGEDGTVKVWDVASGREAFTLHTSAIRSVAFSPDGRWLAGACEDNTARVWDAASGEERYALGDHPDYVLSVAFSPDGRRLAAACDGGTLKVWDLKSARELLALSDPEALAFWSVVFSPDGQRLAAASSGGTVKLWDMNSGKELRTLRGHTGPVLSMTFSADGRRVASAGFDGKVKLWDPAAGQELLTLSADKAAVAGVVFSSDGRRLAAASLAGTVRIWDAAPLEQAGP
jgi:WD40 repeat protein/serine/threonine protein kinase